MRQIKFRIWCEKEKKMYPPIVLQEYMSMSEYAQDDIQPAGEENRLLLEWTGLLDKNGKEIFEGDIIAYRNRKDELMTGIEVKWTGIMGEQGVYGYGYDITPDKCEIIGNIYENPELIK